MYVLRTVVNWGWSSVLITVIAVVSYIYEWPINVVVPVLVFILVIGLVVAVTRHRDREMGRSSLRLRQMAGYFNRRFMGPSSLSIFAIIDSLFKIDDPKLWDWARACDMSQRVFNSWCDSFMSRMESDFRPGGFGVFLHTYLNELWLINTHYYDFVEQFYEIAERAEMPRETVDQYNRFVVEYNAFAQDFRDIIAQLKKVARTEIEPPSVKVAKELLGMKQ